MLNINVQRLAPLSLLAIVAALAGCATDMEEQPSVTSEELQIPAAGCAASRNRDNSFYEFQDDTCMRKLWPSAADREWHCPTSFSTIPSGYDVAKPLSSVHVDTTALADIPREIELSLIVVRRDANGIPHYRYYSNGTHDAAVEPLSSTKFMAAAAAATTLRAHSAGKVGLSAKVGGVPVGDLITVIHNYNEQHYESNALARYFLDVSGRAHANGLIHGWLGRPQAEFFGANYGAPAAPLGSTFVSAAGDTAHVTLDDESPGASNNLSTLTMAEFLKRLVMHREDASTRLPGIQWDDLKTLFYGAEHESWYPLPSESGVSHPRGWGGMTADAAIYLQSAVDLQDRERKAQGRWRIFSKLGYGQSGFVENGYACFPELSAAGQPIANKGAELILSTHFAQPADSPPTSSARDAKVEAYYRVIVGRVLAGTL